MFRAIDHFFTRDSAGMFHPTEAALSRWGNDSLNGPALVGLAARCLELDHGADGFLPTRLTADLFRAARRVPTEVRTRLVREGRRIRAAECDVLQDKIIVAQARMVSYRQSGPPPGQEWVSEDSFPIPADVSGPVYLVGSDGAEWTPSSAEHQNTSRKRVYHRTLDVVAGERPTPFVRTVVAAEATSLVTNLGTRGIGYINGDLTVGMARLPVGDYVGVQADSHWCSDGVAVGAATLFDGEGPFGSAIVTAIANPGAQIDFSAAEQQIQRDASHRDAVLITAEQLTAELAGDRPPAVLDVRWRLDQPDGRDAYLAGHLPGAVYVSLDDDLSDHSRPGLGRHPLPSGAALQAAARRWGLRSGQPVVVYDDWNCAGSARAWWVLSAAGIADVRILDGGLAAWTAAGGAVETGPVQAPPGDVTVIHDNLYAGGRPTLTADRLSEAATVLDARAPERYRGEVEPVDAVAGHVPGARNLPSISLLDSSGRFRPDGELQALAREVGAGVSTAVYCGSGVTASVVLAALSAAGIDAALFPGSWSQWSAEGRPVATG